MASNVAELVLHPWADEDLPLIQELMSDPRVMTHLGGPETREQIERRHKRYAYLPADGIDRMFKIVWGTHALSVGKIGYWKKNWHEKLVYEMGWMVLPAYQGRGIATLAGEAALERVRQELRFPFIHAFPSVENPASNAICRKLGFTLVEECQFEYPPGRHMLVNDWRLRL